MIAPSVSLSSERLSPLRSNLLPYLLIAPPIILIIALIFFPAVQSFIRTLLDDEGGVSLARYSSFFQNPISISNLNFTLQVTIAGLAGLFALCLPIALYLRFSNSRIASWVQTLTLFPLFVPGIMLSYALIRFLRPRGLVETVLNIASLADVYQSPYLKSGGIVIGLIWEAIPFTVLVLIAGLRQVDNALIESARDVGASDLQIFRHILLPLIQRSVLIAFCLNFIAMFGAYTIPYLLGPAAPQTMGVYMQRTFQEFRQPRDAETQAVITFLVCAIVGILYVRAVARQRIGRG